MLVRILIKLSSQKQQHNSKRKGSTKRVSVARGYLCILTCSFQRRQLVMNNSRPSTTLSIPTTSLTPSSPGTPVRTPESCFSSSNNNMMMRKVHMYAWRAVFISERIGMVSTSQRVFVVNQHSIDHIKGKMYLKA